MDIKIIDHSGKIRQEIDGKIEAALDACGIQAVSHAKRIITQEGRRDTGRLINSLSHMVEEKKCFIGTNLEYAPYHEYGTGKFAENGTGRRGWWVYVPGSSKKGRNTGKVYSREEAAKIVAGMRAQGIEAYMTNGIKPIHFLKTAVEEHKDEYQGIIKKILNG